MSVIVETSLGELVVDLYCDDCPLATKNFLKLCKLKYYNNHIFHSVEKNFIAQTGDPTGTGRGGASVYALTEGPEKKFFADEFTKKHRHTKVGLLAMANPALGENGSAFYITLAGQLDYLDDKHTIFGEVAEGLDVLVRLNSVFCDKQHRPYQNVRIKNTEVLDDPFPEPEGLVYPTEAPPALPDQFDEGRLRDDESWEDAYAGMDPADVAKALRAREAKVNATLLTLLGDLPDTDVAPPDNVLFVCKLNPVTLDEDLELIFSQCGRVIKCEVIRERGTGKSLQYAFIEFAEARDCERAREKMDGVIIDDRKIHCDFSQSVATVWSKYRRGETDAAAGSGSSGGAGPGPRAGAGAGTPYRSQGGQQQGGARGPHQHPPLHQHGHQNRQHGQQRRNDGFGGDRGTQHDDSRRDDDRRDHGRPKDSRREEPRASEHRGDRHHDDRRHNDRRDDDRRGDDRRGDDRRRDERRDDRRDEGHRSSRDRDYDRERDRHDRDRDRSHDFDSDRHRDYDRDRSDRDRAYGRAYGRDLSGERHARDKERGRDSGRERDHHHGSDRGRDYRREDRDSGRDHGRDGARQHSRELYDSRRSEQTSHGRAP
jgi:peptidyl-prolyl cis-trans isomerase-like 4